jgi:YggT family protein
MNILGGITSIYMLLIFIRIILTWFTGTAYGRTYEVLSRITDPYLDWFRRFPLLRAGFFDLSPIAALAILSLLNNIFITLGRYGRISAGIILGMILSSLWSAFSFILGFFILILALRLIAYIANRDMYHNTFWRIIDTISQPIQHRLNRIIFRDRPVNYLSSLISSIVVLLVFMILCGRLISLAAVLLKRLPF